MSTAIEQLSNILSEGPSVPRAKLEKMDFVAEYFLTKFREYLSPDSDPYRSIVNPVFSFEFEMSSELFLSQLKVFSLRDGVLPLMKFFAINRSPKKSFPLIVVDSQLSSLVPDIWRSKVVLRQPFALPLRRQKNKLIIFISANPLSLPMFALEEELDRLQKKMHEDDELYLFFSSLRMRGEGEALYDHAWSKKCLLTVVRRFSERNIQILSFQDYQKMDISFCRFTFLNPLCLYFTDSFLFHDASQRGAFFLGGEGAPLSKFLTLNLSINHGFYFHQEFAPFRGERHEKVLDTLFNGLSTYEQTKQSRYIDSKLYSKAFLDWGYDIALELYSSRH